MENELQKLIDFFDESGDMFFSPIDYSPEPTLENLMEMEAAIDAMYEEGQEVKPTTYIPFGMQLGNTLIELIPGAKWDIEDAESPFEMKVTCPDEKGEGSFVAYPIRRVVKYFNDRTDTIYGFAKMVVDQTKGEIDLEKTGEWQDRGDGTKVRVMSIAAENGEVSEEKVRELNEKMGTNYTKADLEKMLNKQNDK